MASYTNLFHLAGSHGSGAGSSRNHTSSTLGGESGQASASASTSAAHPAPPSSLTSSQVESARQRFRKRISQGRVHFKLNPALIAPGVATTSQGQSSAGAKGTSLAKWSERSFSRFEHEHESDEDEEEDRDASTLKNEPKAQPISLLSLSPIHHPNIHAARQEQLASSSSTLVNGSTTSSSPFSRGDNFGTRGRPRQRKVLPHLHLSPRQRVEDEEEPAKADTVEVIKQLPGAVAEVNAAIEEGSSLKSALLVDAPRPILSRLPPLVEFTSLSQLHREEPTLYTEAPTEDLSNSLSALEKAAEEEEGFGSIASQPQGYLQSASRPEVLYSRARLPRVYEASRQLWEALHAFKPLTRDYARGYLEMNEEKTASSAPHPIAPGATADQCPAFSSSTSSGGMATLEHLKQSFNWSSLPAMEKETEGEWYGVAFRSVRRSGSDSSSLYAADRLAHEEAVHSGGLLFYWYGVPDPSTGENLATCVWTSRAEAQVASRLRMHGLAARESRRVYEQYSLFRYRVVKRQGEKEVRLEQWLE